MRYAAALLLALSALAQPEGTGAIGGVVVDSATGDPVRKVIVTLTWHASPRCFATAMTNSAGRFSFESLPPGNYTVSARDERMVQAVRSPAAAPDFTVLGPGERKDDVKIAMTRPGSISGTVLDAEGDPEDAMQVWLLTEGNGPSGRELMPSASALTDEHGEYRFRKVGPGRYFVMTGGEGPRRMMGSFPGQNVEYPIRQFYGGATEAKRASPITLKSGEQASGIDFRIATAPAVLVRATVTGLPAQANENQPPMPGMAQRPPTIELTPVGDNAGGANARTVTGYMSGPNRVYEFPPVAPGRYRAYATAEVEKGMYVGVQEVDVSGDRREISIAVSPAQDIKGQLRAEAGVSLDGVRLTLMPMWVNGRGGGVFSAKIAKDSSFVIPQVVPGHYMPTLDGLPKGAYIRSKRIGGRDLFVDLLDMGAEDPGPLEISVGAKSPWAEGAVDDESTRRHPAAVLLAPIGAYAAAGQLYRSVQTGKDGEWKIEAPPGKYKLIAFEPTTESSLLTMMDVAARLDRFSVLVELSESGERVKAKLALVHAAQVDEVLR